MRYAVDRYILGHEREVAAKSFLPLSYIPSRKERFFCPECGETVFFAPKAMGNSTIRSRQKVPRNAISA